MEHTSHCFVPIECLGRLKDPHSEFKKEFKPVNDVLEGTSRKGVMFEDNLSLHRTDAVFKHISDELYNFANPHFLPEKMTMIIQVIDCHIGMQ